MTVNASTRRLGSHSSLKFDQNIVLLSSTSYYETRKKLSSSNVRLKALHSFCIPLILVLVYMYHNVVQHLPPFALNCLQQANLNAYFYMYVVTREDYNGF
jgi:hypothetical protein